jgi:hypothetical protein
MLERVYRDLVKDLLRAYVQTPAGVEAAQFRAQHEDHLEHLDELEQSLYIEKREDCYQVRLLALAELKNEDEEARNTLAHCERLFFALRDAYKQDAGCRLTLAQLVEKTHLPSAQIRVALTYLRGGPLALSGTGDLLGSEEVVVIPAESFLRYKTFAKVIDQLREWEGTSSFAKRRRVTPREEMPLFMREMRLGLYDDTGVMPTWHRHLPEEIQKLMWEVQFAMKKELSALPSMGLRSVIDCACNRLVGDKGGFSEKLRALVDKDFITSNDRQILENALEVGHASVHRGHFPKPNELKVALDIVGHMLEGAFVLGKASERLRDSAPKRGRA